MRHESLFSGIGGFDLAAEEMGWQNVFHCEWEDFPRKILEFHFPKSISYGDIKQTDFTIHRGKIDVLTGGFPCQPYSQAGSRLGKEDDRHLWPEMCRAIREIQPTWVVGENVLGITNWNEGLVFEEVSLDLEAEGYEVQPFVLPAAGVNAPHQRYRTWFIAHAKGVGTGGLRNESAAKRPQRSDDVSGEQRGISSEERPPSNSNGSSQGYSNQGADAGKTGEIRRREASALSEPLCSAGLASNTNDKRLEGSEEQRGSVGGREDEHKQPSRRLCSRWEDFPTQSPLCGGDDGLPQELDGISVPAWRNEFIKAYGNAIVPALALEIFKIIEFYDHNR